MTSARLCGALWLCAMAALVGDAARAGMPYGPYYGTVARVVDGDTLVVQVRIWPQLTGEYAVRVRGIDAPETHRPSCPEERRRGKAATAFAAGLYPAGLTVRLDAVEPGAFAGRIVADIARPEGAAWLSMRDEMLSAGMAAAWAPGQPGTPWCELAENAAPGG